MFASEFREISKNSLLAEHVWATASIRRSVMVGNFVKSFITQLFTENVYTTCSEYWGCHCFFAGVGFHSSLSLRENGLIHGAGLLGIESIILWRDSVRKSVLRNFAKFTGKYLWSSFFFNKVDTFLTEHLGRLLLYEEYLLLILVLFLIDSFRNGDLTHKEWGRYYINTASGSLSPFYLKCLTGFWTRL